jgi:hypothetical protein
LSKIEFEIIAVESSARVALATEGPTATMDTATNITDKHLVFISCVTPLKKNKQVAQGTMPSQTHAHSRSRDLLPLNCKSAYPE